MKGTENMKRREIIRNSAILAGAAASVGTVFASETKTGSARLGDAIIPPEKEMGKEKHVPIIDAPSSATAGKPFNVTITVGKTVPHPNTVEHHIKWVQLYAQEDGSQYAAEVGKFDFGATYASPTITVPVILKKNSTLYALEHCNLHGIWDYSVKVIVG